MKKFLKDNWLLIFALLYVLSPLDFLPDPIPLFGTADDAGLLFIELIRRVLLNQKQPISKVEKQMIEKE